MNDKQDETGAVTYDDCQTRDRWNRCCCGTCAVCGERKHTAIHGPAFRQPAGSKPWGHQFIAAKKGGGA